MSMSPPSAAAAAAFASPRLDTSMDTGVATTTAAPGARLRRMRAWMAACRYDASACVNREGGESS